MNHSPMYGQSSASNMACLEDGRSQDGSQSGDSSESDILVDRNSHLQVDFDKGSISTRHGQEDETPVVYSSYWCKLCQFWCISPDPECIYQHWTRKHRYPENNLLPSEGYYRTIRTNRANVVQYACTNCAYRCNADVTDSSQMTQHYLAQHRGRMQNIDLDRHQGPSKDTFVKTELGIPPCVVHLVKCVSCEFTHPNYEEVVTHHALSHSEPKYKCRACEKGYQNLAQFTLHLHIVHPGGLPKEQLLLPESHLEGKQIKLILEGPGGSYRTVQGDRNMGFSYIGDDIMNRQNGVTGNTSDSGACDTKSGSKSLKELLATKPMSFNVEASIFCCKYNKACRFSSPNRTELVLNHILTDHRDILSTATVTALKMAVRCIYETKMMNNNDQDSVSSYSNASTPLTIVEKSETGRQSPSSQHSQALRCRSSTSSLLDVKEESIASADSRSRGPSRGPSCNSDSQATEVESGSTSAVSDAEGSTDDTILSSKQCAKWWKAKNSCPGILIHSGLKQLSCRHQGVGGDSTSELLMYLCRECGFWCVNITATCIVQHVRYHMAQVRLAQHWDRDGPRFAALVPVSPEELSPRRSWRRDPLAFYARVPIARGPGGAPVFTVWACPLCDFVHPFHNMAVVHLRVSHFHRHRVYVCSLCQQGEPSESAMQLHFRDAHWKDFPPGGKGSAGEYEDHIVYDEQEADRLEELISQAAANLTEMKLSYSGETRLTAEHGGERPRKRPHGQRSSNHTQEH